MNALCQMNSVVDAPVVPTLHSPFLTPTPDPTRCTRNPKLESSNRTRTRPDH